MRAHSALWVNWLVVGGRKGAAVAQEHRADRDGAAGRRGRHGCRGSLPELGVGEGFPQGGRDELAGVVAAGIVNTHWNLLYWEPMRQYFSAIS